MIDKTHLIKEVCVETYGEAIKAEKLGADRIELCKRLDLGGLTPQRELIEKTLSLSIPIKVMIRPRAGNFIYNENELTIMEDEIETNMMRKTVCGHMFCLKCIKTWLDKNKCCPMCRMKIKDRKYVVKNNSALTKYINSLQELTTNVSISVCELTIKSLEVDAV